MQEQVKKRAVVSVAIICILVCVLVAICPTDIKGVYLENYIVDSICLVVSIILLLRLYIQKKMDLFEPLLIISLVYIAMYFVTPIYDIIIGETDWYGYNVFKYGVKATLIEFIGYCVFYILYTVKFVYRKSDNYKSTKKTSTVTKTYEKSIGLIVAMYIFCFAANVYYMTQHYGSLIYILTLGLISDGSVSETTNASIGFISMFSYCLPTVTLLYWEYGKNKLLKIVMFVPMLMLQVARGFRFFVIQIAITFFSYWYIKKGERPQWYKILVAIAVMMIPILVMTLFRDSIRAGAGMDMELTKSTTLFDEIDAAVWDNFRIYKNVYGMVNAIPSKYGFVYGRQIIVGTMVMLIPRIIWPGKLSSYGGEGLKTIIGKNIADGQAYPNIGEYYYAAGILGVIFFMGVYGLWMKSVKNRYMNSKDGLDIIKFSVLLGVNLQLLIRGYTPSNFWYIVFAILPIWIVKRFRMER